MFESFILRQKKELADKGFSFIYFKIFRRLKNISYFFVLILYLPLFFAALFLRKFIKFRIGLVNAKRVGHLSMNTALYFHQKNFFAKRKFFEKYYDILTYNTPISNQFLFNKFQSKLNLIHPFFIRPLYDLIYFFAKRNHFVSSLLVPDFAAALFAKGGSEDRHDLIMKSSPIISFTKGENLNGKNLLEQLGIKNNKYVCLMVRDAKYLNVRFPNELWNYHDHRNYDIDDFDAMVKLITDRGYHVVRMGRDTDKKINIINKKVIDYSKSQFTSDFADVYLFANCDLCISTSTGAELIPKIFKKTIGQICPSIGFMYTNSNIINGMLDLYCKNTNKKLSIEEMAKRDILHVEYSQAYKNENIEIIKNDKLFFKNYAEFCLDIIEKKINKQLIYQNQKQNRLRFQRFRRSGFKFYSIMYANDKTIFN